MNWKEYENEVFNSLSAYYINDEIRLDVSIRGRYSGRSRQIDIYIRQELNNSDFITIIDCKNYKKKINIKTVESFISMIEDVNADYGVIVSELGYTKGALKRALNNPKGVDLDIYDFKSLTDQFQAESAIPYSGKNAVLVHAPFGWIVDGRHQEIPSICFLYKRGLTFDEALAGGEFAYINFWKTQDSLPSIRQLSDFQLDNIRQHRQIEDIEYQESINTVKKKALIRIVKKKDDPLIEITGFIQFDNFIFFCVCNTTELFVKRNIRKMHLLIRQTLPFKVKRG